MKPNVLVFREKLLPPSETFVLAQGEALARFRAHYVGCSRVAGLAMPEERTHCVLGSDTKLNRLVFKCGFVSPTKRSELAQLNPRLMHVHFGFDAIWAMPLAKSLGIPMIVTYHGHDATTSDDLLRRTFAGRILLARRNELHRRAVRVVAVSRFIRDQLVMRGCPSEKISVHYIGIDTSRFAPEAEQHREPVVVFIGRLVEKKGCQYLLRALAKVRESFAPVALEVVGDGPLRAELEQLAAQLRLSVRFRGSLPPTEVRAVLAKSQILCVPSVVSETGDAEGLGMVFLEAQAMRVPVVSCFSGGIPEAVAHEQSGFLAPERDVEALARYLLVLLSNAELRVRFGEAGRRNVLANFDLQKQAASLEQIYAEHSALHSRRVQ